MTQQAPKLTDRTALLRNRARASTFFLQEEARDELQDRLEMVNRTFTKPAIVTGFPDLWRNGFAQATLVEDDDTLALEQAAHDLVIHSLSLHWADDPIGQIIQCCRALRPDGLFFGAFLGGQTLHELRSCLAQAEADLTGGLSPRVAPMTDVRDAGALLQRAGLALPVADVLPLRVSYDSAFALMRDLRAMGEGNALSQRLRRPTRRAIFDRAAEMYREVFADADRIVATFEIIVLTGWAPAENQQKPLRPGSAKARLSEALGTHETPLKD
ncbi:methyltransferase domain-containing protein [Primorskyibacter sp. S187A]|uniref:methyltransferase domain-containing protein n=1 Tax=Primorskyibacter sp. S187A TaxID=3415130 RepID=UPI003C7D5336